MLRLAMSQRSVSHALVAVLLCVRTWEVARADASTQESMNARTVSDGVYDEAQAARGKDRYMKECSSCHQADLTGSDQAVPLVGEPFILQWENRNVSDLFTSIRTTMPQGTPGQLSSQTYADIVAFLLQANGFPAGASELSRDADVLKAIQIVRPRAHVYFGQAAFARTCAVCHGPDAKGKTGPSLVPFERDYLEIRGIVREGRGEMPAISPADISDEELTQLVAYLKTLGRLPH